MDAALRGQKAPSEWSFVSYKASEGANGAGTYYVDRLQPEAPGNAYVLSATPNTGPHQLTRTVGWRTSGVKINSTAKIIGPPSTLNARPSHMKRASSRQDRARGSEGELAKFAAKFLRGRLEGFEKDMTICLTGIPDPRRAGKTHAYFPALMACCSMLEYVACFYRGPSRSKKTTFIADWRDIARFLNAFIPGVYQDDAVRVLHEFLRNAVAHRSIASGVWVDEDERNEGRRVVWKIYEDFDGPAIQIRKDAGTIKRDSLWECPYTHRVHIRLGSLSRDISTSIRNYIVELEESALLQEKFEKCLRYLYPVDA